jgi:hypothetical protein
LHGEIKPDFIVDVGLFDPSGKRAEPERWLRAPQRPVSNLGWEVYRHHIKMKLTALP